jgi:hypothetical protein
LPDRLCGHAGDLLVHHVPASRIDAITVGEATTRLKKITF